MGRHIRITGWDPKIGNVMCRVTQMGDSGLSLGGGPEFVLRIGLEFRVVTRSRNSIPLLDRALKI